MFSAYLFHSIILPSPSPPPFFLLRLVKRPGLFSCFVFRGYEIPYFSCRKVSRVERGGGTGERHFARICRWKIRELAMAKLRFGRSWFRFCFPAAKELAWISLRRRLITGEILFLWNVL